MSLKIRLARHSDLPRIDELFEGARQFMYSYGNTKQWANGFPSSKIVEPDIEKGTAYVCYEEGNEDLALGVFTLTNYEAVYENLEGGSWSLDAPYVVIHRLAAVQGKGVGQFVFKYVMDKYPYVRLDTHEDNKPMRHLMEKLGFKYVGQVFYSRVGGGYRIAFDYVKEQ